MTNHESIASSQPDAGVTDDRCAQHSGAVNQPSLIPLKAPPHLFEASVNIATSGVTDRTSQTERTCKTCGLTKITVHGNAGQSWREWQIKDGGEGQFLGPMPECSGAPAP